MSRAVQPVFAPADTRGVRTLEFYALGTVCTIRLRHPDETTALRFLADALGWLERFEAKFSRFRPDSAISAINAAAGSGEWLPADGEMEFLLDTAEAMFRLTEGILDSTMLPLLKVWDWKVLHDRLPDESDICRALALVGWDKVERGLGKVRLAKAGMGLDFGGFGKEYAVDRIVEIAIRHGIADLLVDLGHDVFATGGNGVHPFWHVGIQDGLKPDQCVGGLAVSGFGVSSSGDYARRFVHDGVSYGHIVDPRSGRPVRHGTRAVTVLAPNCLLAGVYSTAVFVLGKVEGMKFATCAPSVEVCVQDERGLERTPGFIRRQVQAAPSRSSNPSNHPSPPKHQPAIP
jgi:thiamine biosynthesis lipoprotein